MNFGHIYPPFLPSSPTPAHLSRIDALTLLLSEDVSDSLDNPLPGPSGLNSSGEAGPRVDGSGDTPATPPEDEGPLLFDPATAYSEYANDPEDDIRAAALLRKAKAKRTSGIEKVRAKLTERTGTTQPRNNTAGGSSQTQEQGDNEGNLRRNTQGDTPNIRSSEPSSSNGRKRLPSSSTSSSSDGDPSLTDEERRRRRRKKKKAIRKELREHTRLQTEYMRLQCETYDRTASATERMADQRDKNSSTLVKEIEPDMSDSKNWVKGDFSVEDDGMTPGKLHWTLRMGLRPPNACPSSWWTPTYIKDTETKPVRGCSLVLEHIAGKNRLMNPAIVRALHDRRNYIHYKVSW